ncbi:MAG: hypothetical protein KJO52_11305 [Maribacter sp.]|nr:hypothetical protein [Maribacter sp.]
MTISIVLIVLFAFIGYLLFMKMVLYVDTAKNEYYVQAKGLAKAEIKGHDTELIQIQLKTLFMKFNFFPLRKSKKKKKKDKTDKVTLHKRKTNEIKKIYRLVRTFKVVKLAVDVDTGDCITNAKLYPPSALVNYYGGQFRVNFQGRNRVVLHIENRPIRIIKSFINL